MNDTRRLHHCLADRRVVWTSRQWGAAVRFARLNTGTCHLGLHFGATGAALCMSSDVTSIESGLASSRVLRARYAMGPRISSVRSTRTQTLIPDFKRRVKA